MPRPVVVAYHLIWTAYGWWLPNDPRGSASRTVDCPRIAELGPHYYGLRTTDHPVWTMGGWKGFLDYPDEVRRKIAYINGNPAHIGLPEQNWGFVKPYDGWPLHPGHSPNSPYARRLREKG